MSSTGSSTASTTSSASRCRSWCRASSGRCSIRARPGATRVPTTRRRGELAAMFAANFEKFAADAPGAAVAGRRASRLTGFVPAQLEARLASTMCGRVSASARNRERSRRLTRRGLRTALVLPAAGILAAVALLPAGSSAAADAPGASPARSAGLASFALGGCKRPVLPPGVAEDRPPRPPRRVTARRASSAPPWSSRSTARVAFPARSPCTSSRCPRRAPSTAS